MFQRIKYLIVTYLLFVLLLVLQKPVFLLYHWSQSAPFGWGECLKVLWHGLPMDGAVAGYLTLIPLLLLLVSIPFKGKGFALILKIYFLLISIVIALIFVPDLELYSYWGFRIDATVFAYINQPKNAAASVSIWTVVALFLFVAAWSWMQYYVLNRCVAQPVKEMKASQNHITEPLLLLLLGGLMFIAIRGGVTTSTMNVSRVYFSKSMYLNHAAINPVFSMLSSFKLDSRFDLQYRFMETEQAEEIFLSQWTVPAVQPTDSIPALLNTDRPNIVYILLESFDKAVLESLGGEQGVTPHLDSLAAEGILFSSVYANSFRTDRGVVAALSGYPAQPTMSIIKYPHKSQHLHSLMQALSAEGYHSSFLYGGDVDFAHIKSYLVSQQVTDITRDTDFPVQHLMNKWGAPDHITFPYFLQQIKKETRKPYIKAFLTLSSHEPFDVPYHHFEHPYINSVAYTDSCLGVFIRDFKQLPEWDNTLLVLIPDHGMRYPDAIHYFSPDRHDIFMIWAGGAVKAPQQITQVCSQMDNVSTLLNQMQVDSTPFRFSRNVLHPHYREMAIYTFPNGFGVVGTEGNVVFDCNSNTVIQEQGLHTDSLLLAGKAFLQTLYDDIEAK